jgi:hypothetical protein
VSTQLFLDFAKLADQVVGSIPTRPTNSPNNLDGASARRLSICVMVCVITRRSGTRRGKGYHRVSLRFHPQWLYRSSMRRLPGTVFRMTRAHA